MNVQKDLKIFVPNFTPKFNITLNIINAIPIILIFLVIICFIYPFLARTRNWVKDQFTGLISRNTAKKIKINSRTLASIVFMVVWLLLGGYYLYLNNENLSLGMIFNRNTLVECFKLLLNVILSFFCIWISLLLSQLSTNKLCFILLSVCIISIVYYIVKSYTIDRTSMFILKCIAACLAILLLFKSYSSIKKGIEKFRKICKDLLENIETLFYIYFAASMIFLAQVICIKTIIKNSKLSVLLYVILIFVFDWSYNMITSFVHTFAVYVIYSMNVIRLDCSLQENFSKNKLYRFSFISTFKEVCIRSLSPTVFQLIPGITRIREFFDSSRQSEKFQNIITFVRKMMHFYFDFFNSENNEDLAEWAVKMSNKKNRFKKITKQKDDAERMVNFMSHIRKWGMRIPLILLVFSFLGLEQEDYFIDFNILSFTHHPLRFFKESIENPKVPSISFVLTIFIFTCFFFTIESSFIANQYSNNLNTSSIENPNENQTFTEKVKGIWSTYFVREKQENVDRDPFTGDIQAPLTAKPTEQAQLTAKPTEQAPLTADSTVNSSESTKTPPVNNILQQIRSQDDNLTIF